MVGYGVLFTFVFLAIGYLIGSVLTGVLIGKLFGIDPRTKGSKGAGATNVSRTISVTAGVIVMVLDAGKSMVAVGICFALAKPMGQVSDFPQWLIYSAGLGAIIGHCWPCFFKFKGGKGVACFGGLLLIANPPLAGIAFVLWAITTILTEYVSVGSIVCSIVTAPLPFAYALNYYYLLDLQNTLEIAIAFSVMLFIVWLLIVFQHRNNIKRLMQGTENRAKWAGKVRRFVTF